MKKVKAAKVSFADPVWAQVSDQGKDFISQLLTKEQDKRPSAEQALQHPWILNAQKASKEALSQDVAMGVARLAQQMVFCLALW